MAKSKISPKSPAKKRTRRKTVLDKTKVVKPKAAPKAKAKAPDAKKKAEIRELEEKLTIKQLLFCLEYLICNNATQAAIKAGYQEKAAGQVGYENLNKPQIKKYLDLLMVERKEKAEIDGKFVLNQMLRNSFADVRKLFSSDGGKLKSIAGLDDATAASIQSFEVITKQVADENGEKEVVCIHKIKMVDKKGSLDQIGRNLKLFTDVVEVNDESTHVSRAREAVRDKAAELAG